MIELSRRKLLQLAALGMAAQAFPFGIGKAFAQSATGYRALVCVFLFGGNDADNMILPINGEARTDYEAVRNSLMVTGAPLSIGTVNHASYGPTSYGLHPNMGDLHALASRLAVVANVGTLVRPLTQDQYRNRLEPIPQFLFSHSDQQRQLQTASPLLPSATGWGGRMADVMTSVNGSSNFPMSISMSGANVWLTGASSPPVTLTSGGSLQLSGSVSQADLARNVAIQQLLDFDTGFSLVQEASSTFSDSLEAARTLNTALDSAPALTTTFPNTSLGRQLEQIAKLIQVRTQLGATRQLYFCGTGGFDTHSDQQQRHPGLLQGLSQAMAAFYRATEEMTIHNEVVTFTQSDFGRTFQPNPTLGTDHAWGASQLVLGGQVVQGTYGEFPTLKLDGPDTTDSRGRWIPTTGMDQYGATLASWFGIPSGQLNTVFPNLANFPVTNLGFLA